MTAPVDDQALRLNYLRRQRHRARVANWLVLPLMALAFVAIAPRAGAWVFLPVVPVLMVYQYVQFKAYTQMCPRCGQPLTLTRWNVYRTLPPNCPTCALPITER
jgi:fatty acid desaturase